MAAKTPTKKVSSKRAAPAKTAAAPATGSHLSTEELAILEQQLLKDLRAAQRANADFEDTLNETPEAQSRPGGDAADLGSDVAARENATMLASRSAGRVREITDAIERLRKAPETFGVCVKCSGAIPFARLDILPTTTVCAPCSRK